MNAQPTALKELLSDDQHDLLRLLGFVYLQNGKPQPAATLFHALHLLDPTDSSITRSLACAYVRSGKAEEALTLLDALLQHGDTSSLTYLLRAQAFSFMGHLAEAARAMRFFVQARTHEALPQQIQEK